MYEQYPKSIIFTLLIGMLVFTSWNFADPKISFSTWQNTQESDSSRLSALYSFLEESAETLPYDSAMSLLSNGIDLANRSDLTLQEAQFCRLKGVYLMDESQFDLAIGQFQKSINVASSINDYDLEAESHCLIASTYLKKTDYLNAIEHYKSALNLFEEADNQVGKINALNGIAIVYMDIEEFALAQEFLEEQINQYADQIDDRTKVRLLNNLGTVHRKSGNHQEALDLYNQSIELARLEKYEIAEAVISSNIALARIGLNDTTDLRNLLRNSLSINSAHQYKKGMAQSMVLISQYVFDIGSDSAIALNKQALAIAQEIGTLEEGKMASEQLYHIYKSLGDAENALMASDMNALYKDSIDMETAKFEIIKANFAQELSAREQSVDQLRQNTVLLSAGIALVLGISIFIYYRQQLVNSKKKSDLFREIEELKEKMLSNQITIGNDEVKPNLLSRDKVSAAIDGKLNDTDWKILNLLITDPFMSNRDIAESVSLSMDGAGSSLRKMYSLFELQDEKNKKVALVRKSITICS